MTLHLYRCDVCRGIVALTDDEARELEELRSTPENSTQLTFPPTPHVLCEGTIRQFATIEANA